MAIINPIHLHKWLPDTPIVSSQTKAEFQNIYTLVNGNLDAANIKDGSVTTAKLANGSITADKIATLPASKIQGRLTPDNLPTNVITATGGTLTGGITFDVPTSTALLKNYEDEEVVLYEGGTGEQKLKIIVGGTSAMKITLNGVVLWQLTKDGLEIPTKFKVPTV